MFINQNSITSLVMINYSKFSVKSHAEKKMQQRALVYAVPSDPCSSVWAHEGESENLAKHVADW